MPFDEETNYCAYCGCESDEPYCSRECWEKHKERHPREEEE